MLVVYRIYKKNAKWQPWEEAGEAATFHAADAIVSRNASENGGRWRITSQRLGYFQEDGTAVADGQEVVEKDYEIHRPAGGLKMEVEHA